MDGNDELIFVTMTNSAGKTEDFRLDKQKHVLIGETKDYPASEVLIGLLEAHA